MLCRTWSYTRPVLKFAKVLGKGPYKPKVEKGRDAYIRRPKHPRPAVEEGE